MLRLLYRYPRYGKGFEAYYERAKKAGVRYIRCQPSSLKQIPSSKDIVVRYQDEQGRLQEENFEMVMLSCGLRPSKAGQLVSDTFGVRLNGDGFCVTKDWTGGHQHRGHLRRGRLHRAKGHTGDGHPGRRRGVPSAGAAFGETRRTAPGADLSR